MATIFTETITIKLGLWNTEMGLFRDEGLYSFWPHRFKMRICWPLGEGVNVREQCGHLILIQSIKWQCVAELLFFLMWGSRMSRASPPREDAGGVGLVRQGGRVEGGRLRRGVHSKA